MHICLLKYRIEIMGKDALMKKYSWKDEYNVIIAISALLVIASTAFEISATSHMKKAVSIYNGEEQGYQFDFDGREQFASGNRTINVVISWHF